MSRSTRAFSVVALAAILSVTFGKTGSWAATITFTGTTSAAGTFAPSNGNFVYPFNGAVTTFAFDGTNFGGTTPSGNDVVFDGTAAGAAGTTYPLAVPSASQTPLSIIFSDTPGSGVGKNYTFLRASTSTGSGNSIGFTGGSAGTAGTQDVDSFSSVSPFGTSATPPVVTLTLASNYTGKVILRARPGGVQGAGSVTNINGGTLEIHDALALPASGANQNAPVVNLGGGTLAININAGNFETAEGNRNPANTNLTGTLNVTRNSTFGNTATDFAGNPRSQNTIWNGPIQLDSTAGDVTLNLFSGGGTTIGGAGFLAPLGGNNATVTLDNSTSFVRLASFGAGGASIAFDLGNSGGILDTTAAANTTQNLGRLLGGANAVLRGTNAGGNANPFTYSIGGMNLNDTYNGQILNGVNAQTGSTGPTTALLKHTTITKAGAGILTLTNANRYSGATNVNAGTLQSSNARAFGESASNINVNAGGTLDLNANAQFVGKSFVLNGGSLMNNGGAAVSIHSGASGNIADNGTATSNGAIWGAGTQTTVGQITTLNGGTVPTVNITGGGGSGAAADVKMQLGWLRINPGVIGNAGGGYTRAPTITFDAPSDPNGRRARAFAVIGAPGAGNAGVVTAMTIVDPGWGYTSVPNVTIDNTGTGGSGFLPVFAMAASDLSFTNAGSGYTSAPTIAIGNLGTLPSYAPAGATAALVAPVTNGGFGRVNLTANSNVGGTGPLSVDVPITSSGLFGITKIGAGTTTLTAANTYTGTTTVNAGTLLVNGSTVSDTTVGTGATLGGTGSINNNVFVGNGGTIAPGTSIGTIGVGIPLTGVTLVNGTYKAEFDGTGAGAIDLLNAVGSLILGANSRIDFDQVALADDAAYVFAKYSSLIGTFANVVDLPANYVINYAYNDGSSSNNIALVQVPEPTTFGLLALGSLGLLFCRKKR